MPSLRSLPALCLILMFPALIAEAAPLAHVEIVANGVGAVEPPTGDYEIGTRLILRALPSDGFAFGGWTDPAGVLLSPASEGQELEYMVVGAAQVVAHFAVSPFGETTRNWTAWLRTCDFDAGGQPRTTARGLARLTLSRTGAFSGKLRFGGENFVLLGTFDASGRASISFPRTGRKPLSVVLRVQLEQPREKLVVAIYDGEVCAMSSVSVREAPGLGACYTVSLRSDGVESMTAYATLKRTMDGSFRGIGSLDNGTAFCFATRPGVDHGTGGMVMPVDALLADGGSLSGLITLQDAVLPVVNFSAKLQRISPPSAGSLPPPAAVNTVFVGPSGDDTNAGMVDSPLATLDAALTRIGGAGEIVMLPGNYEHASLNLAPASKVTLQAAPGHAASVFFGEKIMGGNFVLHEGNVWKTNVQSSVPVQGSENRFWIFELGTHQGVIANGTTLPQQRLRATRLDHFRLVQASSIANVDAANGRYFISGNTLYLRTSSGEPPRLDQEFRIPSQAPNDSVVFGAGPQAEITLRGIDVYFASNGANVSNAASYVVSGCSFFGSGNSGILAQQNATGIEERCEYAANANDGCSPVNYTSVPSLITVIDPWSHDNGDEGHSLHGQCRGFYFAGLYEFNAQGGITPAIGSSAVIQSVLTRGNVAGICPTVNPAVNTLVSDWTSIGDFDGLENWTSGQATVVSSRVLNPLRYSFNGVISAARIAVFDTILQGGLGVAAGAGQLNTTISPAPIEIQRKNSPQAMPVDAAGSRFEVPGPNQRVAPFVSRLPNGYIVVQISDPQGASLIELAESFTVDTANHVAVTGANPHQLTIEIDAQTGWFTGQFHDSAPLSVTRNFSGVIFQSQHYGTGFSPGAAGNSVVTMSIPYLPSTGTPAAPALTLNKPAPSASARYGHVVSVSGSRLAVGACQHDMSAGGTGSVFLYDLQSATPAVPAATVNNPSPAVGGKFGISVAISGSRMVVGAPVCAPGAMADAKAYVYDLSGPIPTLVATLNNPSLTANGSFGSTVAISGIWIMVGAPADGTEATTGGRVYSYTLLNTVPTLMATLNNPSPAANDRFGSALAMSGTRAVVGAFQDDTGAIDAGSAYVYNLIGANPHLPFATLNNPSPAAFDHFGCSVAISGTRVVVGATGDDTGAPNAGSAYAYELTRNPPTVPVSTLNKPNPSANDQFGQSVAISGLRTVVGASLDDAGGPDAGSAYVFELGSGTAAPAMTLNAPNPAYFDQFGRSVAVDGSIVAVGLPVDETIASERGSVYTYTAGRTMTVAAGTNAVTEGGIFDSIVIEGGGTLTLKAPPSTGTLAVGVPSIRLSGTGNSRHLVVEFVRNKQTGLIYTVEFGDSPADASFQPALNAPIVTPIDADFEQVVVEDTVTVGSRPLRLGRLRTTAP